MSKWLILKLETAQCREGVAADGMYVWGQVSVIRDEVAAISAEIRGAAPNHEVVLTAGGLGPTCDDVTMAGIADALGRPLER